MSTRASAARAERAAEALDAFLRTRSITVADVPAAPPETLSAVAPADVAAAASQAEAARNTVPGAAAAAPGCGAVSDGSPLCPPHTDWLHHRLTITGPAETLACFQAAAAGAGTIPWRLDLPELQEDWFHLLANPLHRTLGLPGARILARQLREAVEARHALATARVGHSRACPLDLHALAPVPPDVLALGPDHPQAIGWLWRHWGTTEMPRHVAVDTTGEGREAPPQGDVAIRLVFWSADWTPWRAFERIRADWPTLRFDVRPRYA